MAAFGVSIRRACRALGFNLSTYFYRHRRPDQAPLRMRLRAECLNQQWFETLLGWVPPQEFKTAWQPARAG